MVVAAPWSAWLPAPISAFLGVAPPAHPPRTADDILVRLFGPSDARRRRGPLAGRVALVAGGTSGIGAAAALALARAGASVVIAGRSDERGVAVVDASRGDVAFRRLDLDDAASVDAACAEVGAWPRLDVLVLSAGSAPSPSASAWSRSRPLVDPALVASVGAQTRLARAAAPALERAAASPPPAAAPPGPDGDGDPGTHSRATRYAAAPRVVVVGSRAHRTALWFDAFAADVDAALDAGGAAGDPSAAAAAADADARAPAPPPTPASRATAPTSPPPPPRPPPPVARWSLSAVVPPGAARTWRYGCHKAAQLLSALALGEDVSRAGSRVEVCVVHPGKREWTLE